MLDPWSSDATTWLHGAIAEAGCRSNRPSGQARASLQLELMAATRSFERIPFRLPAEPLAWMGAGNAQYELGSLEAASTDLEHAPGSWPVRLNLGQVLLELDRSCLGQQVVEAEPMLFDHPAGRSPRQPGPAARRGLRYPDKALNPELFSRVFVCTIGHGKTGRRGVCSSLTRR